MLVWYSSNPGLIDDQKPILSGSMAWYFVLWQLEMRWGPFKGHRALFSRRWHCNSNTNSFELPIWSGFKPWWLSVWILGMQAQFKMCKGWNALLFQRRSRCSNVRMSAKLRVWSGTFIYSIINEGRLYVRLPLTWAPATTLALNRIPRALIMYLMRQYLACQTILKSTFITQRWTFDRRRGG